MLTIIHRYIGGRFLRAFVLIELTAWALFLLIEGFELRDDMAENGVALGVVLQYLLLKSPYIVVTIAPAAILIAIFASLGPLARRSEITAMLAGGISLYRLAAPIWMTALVVTLLSMTAGEHVVPSSYAQAQRIKHEVIQDRPVSSSRIMNAAAPLAENRYLRAAAFEIPQGKMTGGEAWRFLSVSLEQTEPNYERVSSFIYADTMVWADGRWILENVFETDPRPGRIRTRTMESLVLDHAPEPAALLALIRNQQTDFIVETKEVETVPTHEIYQDLQKLRSLPNAAVERYTRKLRIDLQYKFAFPLVNLILAVIGTTLVAANSRSASFWMSFFAALVLTFGYWVLSGTARSLGYAGTLPAFTAVWGVPLIYSALAFLMLRRAQT